MFISSKTCKDSIYEDMTNVFRRIANKDVGSSNYFTRDTHCLLRRPFVGLQVRHSPYSAIYIDQFQLLYYKKFFSVFFSPLESDWGRGRDTHVRVPLSFIYLEKARQSFFSQTVEAKNMADF